MMVHTTRPPLRVAMLFSGRGTGLRHLQGYIHNDGLNIEVVGGVASRQCPGVDVAAELGFRCVVIERTNPFNADKFSARITAQLLRWHPEVVVAYGFRSPYHPPQDCYFDAVNIHPTLCRKFDGWYGDKLFEAIWNQGGNCGGCRLHRLDPQYDKGETLRDYTIHYDRVDGLAGFKAQIQAAEEHLLFLELRSREENCLRPATRSWRAQQAQGST